MVVQTLKEMKAAGLKDEQILKGLKGRPEEFNKYYQQYLLTNYKEKFRILVSYHLIF